MDPANENLATSTEDSLLDVATLESSFQLIAPRAEEFVAAFYDKLFELYPQTRRFFAATDMVLQGKKLVSALVLVMENLRNPETLGSALMALGLKHQSYNVGAEHYPMVGDALLKTLGAFLGEAWKPEVENAWARAYGAIARGMLSGYAARHAP